MKHNIFVKDHGSDEGYTNQPNSGVALPTHMAHKDFHFCTQQRGRIKKNKSFASFPTQNNKPTSYQMVHKKSKIKKTFFFPKWVSLLFTNTRINPWISQSGSFMLTEKLQQRAPFIQAKTLTHTGSVACGATLLHCSANSSSDAHFCCMHPWISKLVPQFFHVNETIAQLVWHKAKQRLFRRIQNKGSGEFCGGRWKKNKWSTLLLAFFWLEWFGLLLDGCRLSMRATRRERVLPIARLDAEASATACLAMGGAWLQNKTKQNKKNREVGSVLWCEGSGLDVSRVCIWWFCFFTNRTGFVNRCREGFMSESVGGERLLKKKSANPGPVRSRLHNPLVLSACGGW